MLKIINIYIIIGWIIATEIYIQNVNLQGSWDILPSIMAPLYFVWLPIPTLHIPNFERNIPIWMETKFTRFIFLQYLNKIFFTKYQLT